MPESPKTRRYTFPVINDNSVDWPAGEPDFRDIGSGRNWLNALAGKSRQGTGQLVCVCGEAETPAESWALFGFVAEAMSRKTPVETKVVSSVYEKNTYTSRLACLMSGLVLHEEWQAGGVDARRKKQVEVELEKLRNAPLQVFSADMKSGATLLESVEGPHPVTVASKNSPRLVILQGVPPSTLPEILTELRRLAHERGITIVLHHALKFKNDKKPAKLTRSGWMKEIPSEVMHYADLCLLMTGAEFVRNPCDENFPEMEPVWFANVLKRECGVPSVIPLERHPMCEALVYTMYE